MASKRGPAFACASGIVLIPVHSKEAGGKRLKTKWKGWKETLRASTLRQRKRRPGVVRGEKE